MPFRDSPVSSRKLSAWLLRSDVVWQPEPGRSPRHPLRLPLTPPRNFRPWGLVIPTPAPTSPPQRRLTLARRPGPSPAPPRWHRLCAPSTLEGTSRHHGPHTVPRVPGTPPGASRHSTGTCDTSQCFLPAPATPVPHGAGRSRRGSWPALGPRLAGTLARPLGAWVFLLQETGRSSSSPSRGRGAGGGDRTREAAGAQCPRGPRDAEWGRGAHAARALAPGESVSIPAFSGTHGDRGQSHSGAPLSRPQHPPGAVGKTGMKPMRSAPSARNEIRTQDQR